MQPQRRLRASAVVTLTVVAVAAVAARLFLDVEWSLESLRALVAGLGAWGPAVFVLLLALRSILLIPSQVLLIAAGVCFGAGPGTLYGAIGVTLSGALAFGVARWLGREALLSQVPPRIRAFLDGAGQRGTAAVVFLGTAYPVGPITAYHAGAALTGMAVPSFLLAVAPAAVIRAGVYTLFGSRLGEGDVAGSLILGGVLILLAAPLAVPSWRRRIVARLFPGPDGGGSPPAA